MQCYVPLINACRKHWRLYNLGMRYKLGISAWRVGAGGISVASLTVDKLCLRGEQSVMLSRWSARFFFCCRHFAPSFSKHERDSVLKILMHENIPGRNRGIIWGKKRALLTAWWRVKEVNWKGKYSLAKGPKGALASCLIWPAPRLGQIYPNFPSRCLSSP